MRAHEFVDEKINPESVKPGFKKEKWIMGKYLMKAEAMENPENPNIQGIIVRVYDPKSKSIWIQSSGIGHARFLVHQDKTGDEHMEVSFVMVDNEYQRQGIASAMYQFARELGNDVKPSNARSDDAKAFWNAGAGAGKEFPEQPPPPEPEPKPEVKPQPAQRSWWSRLRGNK